jgi:hypothetical protein
VLRGSIVTAALCPGGRAPADVDYLVPGAGEGAAFDAGEIEAVVRAVVARPDPRAPLELVSTEVIWAETASPGLRAHVAGEGGARFQVDVASGDPMCVPPRMLEVARGGGARTPARTPVSTTSSPRAPRVRAVLDEILP